MKQYYQGLSLKVKLFVIFLLVIIANFVANLFYRHEVKNLIEFYNVSQTEHYRVNKISVSLKNAKLRLDEYYSSGEEDAADAYEAEKGEVLAFISQLTNVRNNPAEWYMIHAITNSAEVFFQKSDITVRKKRGSEDFIYIEYYQASKIQEYLNGYLNEYLNILLEKDGEEYARLERKAANIEAMTRVFLVGSVLISLLAALNLSETVTSPICKLAEYTRKISKGNFELEDIQVASRDEVGELAVAFNRMKDDIRRLIEELNQKSQVEARLHQQELKNIRMDELLKESQLLALQSQINPHFLFNTLNSISRSAQYETPDVTTALIRNLADLFRYNLDHFNRLSTVEEELEIVAKYIYIQQHRFGERIQYAVRVEETDSDYLIPSMTLQPLVENAIIHGIENLEFGGTILVDVSCRGGFLRIRICDNGCGIERERLREIWLGNDEKRRGHTTGIGLSNIAARIGLYPGGVCRLYSSPRYGTIVEILFPQMTEEKNEL